MKRRQSVIRVACTGMLARIQAARNRVGFRHENAGRSVFIIKFKSCHQLKEEKWDKIISCLTQQNSSPYLAVLFAALCMLLKMFWHRSCTPNPPLNYPNINSNKLFYLKQLPVSKKFGVFHPVNQHSYVRVKTASKIPMIITRIMYHFQWLKALYIFIDFVLFCLLIYM